MEEVEMEATTAAATRGVCTPTQHERVTHTVTPGNQGCDPLRRNHWCRFPCRLTPSFSACAPAWCPKLSCHF
eukprot:TRINITY_DN9172_c0_g1_i1.p4 TRINITY_DN9172_c0_g1~~TRINITY_DN9172_c0_g1_i1.p4  ORF type:complete len:72 (-),score=12.37 TRINITY_DN9172_c0_g1_i1:44-259(-)